MSPPVRAHLISLSLVLGLTVSLVWGQAPTHFTLSGVTVTGPLPITSVGRGVSGSPSLICYTTNAASAVWLFPSGTEITESGFDHPASHDAIMYFRDSGNGYILLRRGASVLSPGGDYCCGSATNANERLCINLVMDCGTPPSISNGVPGTPTSTTFEGTVTYSCNNGHQISPGITMTTVSCLDTGNWGVVTCLVVCGTPPSISNGSPGTPTNTLLGGTVTYTCNNGYQISPGVTMTTASCLATGNWETVPTCSVLCPILSVLDNGMISYLPTNSLSSVGTMATYQCNVGYILIGVATRTCGNNGVWSGEISTCEAVECGPPPSISNGSPGTPTKTIFEGNVTYTCNNGYQISPGITMTPASCLATGNWETIPTCTAVDCGPPPSISNGSPGSPSKTTFEGTVTYTCTNGYQISPEVTMATASCLATGNWETVPNCLAMCLDLQPLMNGAITYQPAGTVQLEETNATHSCTSGYRLSGGPVRVCQSDRTWSGNTITCLAICPALQAITNGNISYSSADRLEGGTAVYSCTDGFQLSSGSTRTCEDSGTSGGVWNGMEPSCLAIRVVPSADNPPTPGQSYSLTCTVTGTDSLNPTISYQWTRGSTTVGTNAILTFDPLMLSDTGQYRCEVTLSSNLLSENIKVVSDMFDLVIPTVFIELLFRGIHNCPEYRQTNANGIVQDVTNGLTEAIQGLCGCGLTSNHVFKSFLQCFSDSPDQIAFRAKLNQTTQATTEELVSYIDEWIRNPGHLSVQGSLLQLNTTCSLVITNQFVSSECPTTIATETLPSSAPPSSQPGNTGAIVSAVVVILGLALILAVTAVIIAYLVLKQRRMGGVDFRTPDITLTDRDQSSTENTYDTVAVTYERVGVPYPQKGSYEYSQCETCAPTPGGGVVNDVKIHGAPVTST